MSIRPKQLIDIRITEELLGVGIWTHNVLDVCEVCGARLDVFIRQPVLRTRGHHVGFTLPPPTLDIYVPLSDPAVLLPFHRAVVHVPISYNAPQRMYEFVVRVEHDPNWVPKVPAELEPLPDGSPEWSKDLGDLLG